MKLLDMYVTRGRRTASRVFDGVAVILLLPRNSDDKNDPAFELGPAGTYFWELLEKDLKCREIVARFMKKYSIGRKEAVQQVTGFVASLRREQLIEVKKKPDHRGKPWLA